ncbi:MAG TPA: glycosyltransferase family 39 protein [Verrucomicrobiae bacterium]|nr:glycosyltransferase family 39 protein [Verrucomicrobiae bacterium]
MPAMDSPPAKTDSRSSWAGRWPWLLVLVVILFAGFVRFRLLEVPLERDEGEYAYAGQLILQGIPPYELAYNMKLPGTYYAYAFGMAVFGQTTVGVHLTLLLVNTLTIVFVFMLARRLFGVTAGVVAAASYAVMAVSPTVLGMAAHANHFVVLFAVPATLLLLHAGEQKDTRMIFIAGLLYGLALMMKQQAACFALFGGLYLAWQAAQEKNLLSKDFLKRGLVFSLGVILPLGIFCLTCIIAGDFARFEFWTFVYARNYAAILTWSRGWNNLIEHLELGWHQSLGVWLLALAAPLLMWRDAALRKPVLLATGFWVCSFLGTSAGLFFRTHYFILVLPAVAILAGGTVAALQKMSRSQAVAVLPVAGFIVILGWMIACEAAPMFQYSPMYFCQLRYAANPFAEAEVVAGYIREHSAPDARIAVLGSEPEIYFYAQRHSATGYIYVYPLMEPQHAARAMQHEMMQEITSAKPEFVVLVNYQLSWLNDANSDTTIVDWMREYVPAFYDEIGSVGLNEKREVAANWVGTDGPDVTLVGGKIEVYRRKPDADPAKTN